MRTFKVGEIVRIKQDYFGFKKNELIRLTSVDERGQPLAAEHLDKRDWWHVSLRRVQLHKVKHLENAGDHPENQALEVPSEEVA